MCIPGRVIGNARAFSVLNRSGSIILFLITHFFIRIKVSNLIHHVHEVKRQGLVHFVQLTWLRAVLRDESVHSADEKQFLE